METPNQKIENTPRFIFPDTRSERGEVERTAKVFSPNNPRDFVEQFILKSAEGRLSELSDDDWNRLENTDSKEINKNDWVKVAELAEGHDRDWKTIKLKMESGEEIDAPMIYKHKNLLYLVSGNTRLMVAKALSARPQVVFVEF